MRRGRTGHRTVTWDAPGSKLHVGIGAHPPRARAPSKISTLQNSRRCLLYVLARSPINGLFPTLGPLQTTRWLLVRMHTLLEHFISLTYTPYLAFVLWVCRCIWRTRRLWRRSWWRSWWRSWGRRIEGCSPGPWWSSWTRRFWCV